MRMKKIIFLATFMLPLLFAMAQNRTITGKVTDENGNGLVNASVVIKGTNVGTTTATDGSFTLSVPSNASTLIVSYVGLGEKEITLTNINTYNISLAPGSNGNLNEVVVVAYGTQQRRKITGAISKVLGSEVENIPMTSVDQILQGKV